MSRSDRRGARVLLGMAGGALGLPLLLTVFLFVVGATHAPAAHAAGASLVQAHNQVRAAHGLRSLRVDARLTRMSRRRARHLVQTRVFTHAPLDPVLALGFTLVGENLADGGTPQSAMRAWMASPSHRANLLDPRFTRIGTATLAGYRVVLFGRP